jgi:hypothetical protein
VPRLSGLNAEAHFRSPAPSACVPGKPAPGCMWRDRPMAGLSGIFHGRCGAFFNQFDQVVIPARARNQHFSLRSAPWPRLAGTACGGSWDSIAMAIWRPRFPSTHCDRFGIGPGLTASAAVRRKIEPDSRGLVPRKTPMGVSNIPPLAVATRNQLLTTIATRRPRKHGL